MSDLQRYQDPFAGITTLHSQLDDIFNNMFGSASLANNLSTAMDLYTENDDKLVAEVQAPGFSKDDIEVDIHNGVLEIKGQKNEKEEHGKAGKKNYMLRESSSSFYRRIALPKHADGDHIEAHFDNGVLKVVVPFKELPKPKRVEISSKK